MSADANHLSDETLQCWVDSLLEGEARAQAETHLASCEACQALVREYAELFGGLASLPVPPMPARFTAQVMERVVAKEQAQAAQRRLALVTIATSLAAAAACLLGVGNPGWAHLVSSWSETMVSLSHAFSVLASVFGPLISVLRVPLICASSALCIPLLMMLHRSIPGRSASTALPATT
jgi:anti-sigma factor RsiW